MSKSDRNKRRHKHDGRPKPPAAPKPTPDSTYYFGLSMIGLFGLIMWWFISDQMWLEGLVGLAAITAGLVVFHTFRAWRGMEMAGWHKALARLPLRFAGYHQGADGKPLEAAKGQADAQRMLLLTLVISVVVVGGLVAWMLM